MCKEAKDAVGFLSAFFILQIILVAIYKNYGVRYIGDFALFPATFNNPEKISFFTYWQIGLTAFITILFSLSNYFNGFMLKAFRGVLIVLIVVGLCTTYGIAFISMYSVSVINKIIKI